jgi:hypothetical protein
MAEGMVGTRAGGRSDAEALLERGEVVAALRRATTVDLSALPSLERRSTHYVNVSRAHALRRHDAEALAATLLAERFNMSWLLPVILIALPLLSLLDDLARRDLTRTLTAAQTALCGEEQSRDQFLVERRRGVGRSSAGSGSAARS